MREEKTPLSPTPESSEAGAAAPSDPAPAKADVSSKGKRVAAKHQKQSVFQYLAILFAAAFLLLFFTFMMEKRQFEQLQQENQEQIDDLQQSSINAVHSLNSLYDENERLKNKAAALESQIKKLEEQLQQQTQAYQSGQSTLYQTIEEREKSIQAMDWFWQIDEAYVRGRTEVCKDLIYSISHAGLVEYLPKVSITDNGRFSPYDRYFEIYNAIYP